MSISIRYARSTARSLSRSTIGFVAVWSRLRMPIAACAVSLLLAAALAVVAYRSAANHPQGRDALPALSSLAAAAPTSVSGAFDAQSSATATAGSSGQMPPAAMDQAAAAQAAESAQSSLAQRSPSSPQSNLTAEQQAAGARVAASAGKSASGVSGGASQTATQAALQAGASGPALNAASRSFNWSNAPKHAQQGSAERIARVIAQRYQIAQEAARLIAHEAFDAAAQEKIDPLLSLSVIAVESRFNPFSASGVGALGLTQTLPQAHPEEMQRVDNRREKLLDVGANIRAGARILAACEKRYKGNDALALQCYNGSVSDSSRSYSGKVLAVRSILRQALWSAPSAPVARDPARADRAEKESRKKA